MPTSTEKKNVLIVVRHPVGGIRAYFRYVPKGTFVTEYTVRLNNPGTFNLPATRVEAMYAPEMFGEIPNVAWNVAP